MAKEIKDILDLIEPLGEEKGTNEIMDVVNSEEDVYTEFVVLSNEELTSSDREVLADLGYVIFYENNLVSRLFGVRNESGSVEELDELTFVEKASESTKDYSEIMGLAVDV